MRSPFLLSTVIFSLHHFVFGEKIYSSVHPLQMQANSTQCSDSDRNTWQSSSSANNQFFNNIDTCTSQAAGSTDLTSNVTNCMTTVYPNLSQSCAQCFGEDVDCGATNCRVPCQNNSNGSECQSCLQPCSNTLSTCTGTTNNPKPESTSSNGVSGGSMGGMQMVVLMVVVVMMSHTHFFFM